MKKGDRGEKWGQVPLFIIEKRYLSPFFPCPLFSLETEDFFEFAGLGTADGDFTALMVIHHDGVGAVEIGDELAHAFNIDQVTAVGAEKEIRIQAGFQFSQGKTGEVRFFLSFGKDIVFICIDINNFLRAEENGFAPLLYRDDFQRADGAILRRLFGEGGVGGGCGFVRFG